MRICQMGLHCLEAEAEGVACSMLHVDGDMDVVVAVVVVVVDVDVAWLSLEACHAFNFFSLISFCFFANLNYIKHEILC